MTPALRLLLSLALEVSCPFTALFFLNATLPRLVLDAVVDVALAFPLDAAAVDAIFSLVGRGLGPLPPVVEYLGVCFVVAIDGNVEIWICG